MPLTKLNHAREILEAVIDEPIERRADVLSRLCAGNEELREQLTRVLKEIDGDSFMATPLVAVDDVSPTAMADPLPVLKQIGRYELIRMIGEGGMGAVYEARQENPRRMVALKVLRAGLFSAEASRRFQRESQLLGLLHHPCIAQVYEAGAATTPLGEVPYFAMELVRGSPLSVYLKEHSLSVRAKLQLLATICDAVEHAHRQGIVHRDLKPANILIEAPEAAQSRDSSSQEDSDEHGRPKVLDFGVARAVGSELYAATIQTGVGQIVGTLSYMSPEQVTGNTDQVDARCDVYSLGVVAYEMLSGRLPIDVRGRPFPEVTQSILHEEPTRLRSLDSRLGGDIDTIVAKAIEKDPSRRYQSAAALAADIRRFLRDEPIVARPATSLYQLRKFARRNRTIVAGVLATFITLLAGAVTTAYWAVRATERRALAEQNAELLKRRAYRASIAAAQSALERGQSDTAHFHLENAPPELRGWEWSYLESMVDRSDRTIDLAAMGYVRAALDGPWAFLQGNSGHAIMNWVDGRVVPVESSVNIDALYAFSMSPRGDRFAICGAIASALYDATTGRAVRRLPRDARFETQAFSRDGSMLVAVAMQPQELLVFDAATGGLRKSIPLAGATRAFPAMSPAEDIAAVDVADGVIGIVELESGRIRHTFPGTQPQFSADGSIVLAYTAAAQQTRLETWSASDGRLLGSLDLPDKFVAPMGGGVRNVAINPDGTLIAVLQDTSAISIHDSASLRSIGVLGGLPIPIGGTFTGVSFSGDGRWLAGVPGRSVIKVWDLIRSAVPFAQAKFRDLASTGAAVSPDGRFTATGDWGQITCWNSSTGAPVWSIFPSFEFVTSMVFSPDGSKLAIGGDKGTVHIVDAADGRTLVTASPHGVVEFGSGWVAAMDWAPGVGGVDRFVTGFADGTLMQLDPVTLKVVRRAKVGEHTIRNLALSPQSEAIAMVLPGNPARVVIHADIEYAEEITWQLVDAVSVAWDATGERMAVGHATGVNVFDARGREQLRLVGARAEQSSVTFSPDGKRIAAGSRQGGIALWDAHSGDLAIDLVLPRVDASLATRFTTDGKSLVGVTTVSPVRRFDINKPTEAEADARELSRRATGLYEQVYSEAKFARETVERLRDMPGVDPEVRDEAIRRADVLGDQVAVINNLAFIRSRQAMDEATLRAALRESEAVIARCPDGFGLLTRAMVLYWAGRFDEAETFFQRAAAALHATRPSWGSGSPEYSCFRGLTAMERGFDAKALEWFDVFDHVIQEPRYHNQPELDSYAEAVSRARAKLADGR